jgi:CubicO group peptidase (beta-lactamase class C family)
VALHALGLSSVVAAGRASRSLDVASVERRLSADASAGGGPRQASPFPLIDACVNQEMRAVGAPGASIAIAVSGTITYTKGYGVRHRENGGAVDERTRFRIGSSTKMMTAATLLALADAGRIDLHAPITRYLPDLRLPPPWDPSAITVHHLLSGTSGLSESYRLHRLDLFQTVPLATWAQDLLPRTPLAAPPGSFWNYSNPAFSLAGYLIERVTGTPHGEVTAQMVWAPAGMSRSTFSTADVMADGNFAWGHEGSRRVDADDLPGSVLGPAGMAYSTPTDMVTWALTLMQGGGSVLSAPAAEAMQSRHATTDWSPKEGYGYGVFVDAYRDRQDGARDVTVYQHGGNTTGWGSELYWVPERGIALSILDNSTASLYDAAHCVLRELAAVLPPAATGAHPGPQALDAFVGTYAEMNQALWDATLRVTRTGDRLRLQRLEAGTSATLVSLFDHTFGIDEDGDGRPDSNQVTRRFTFSDEGAAPGRTRWMHNRIQVAERVGDFPAAIALKGTACQAIPFTTAFDVPQLAVRSAGLVPPGRQLTTGLPIAQDDPADPSSASYKRDLTVRGEAGLLTVRLVPQSGDVVELYLLADRDGDGRFSYPDELVDVGWEGQGYRLMTVTGRPPAGRYQLWAHGLSVRGSGHTFSLETQLVDGEALRILNAPLSATAGQPQQATVCARDVAGLAKPMAGLVEFDYGSPPRRVRIPVTWEPDGAHRVHLPLAGR